MPGPRITLAASTHFELQFLIDGTVPIEGFEMEYPDGATAQPPFFSAIVSTSPYDIGELALSHYIIAKSAGVPLTAVPVFPSKFLPHIGLMVHRSAGISGPKDLVGKRIAAPDWGFNPAVWVRGLLADQYDVPAEQCIWVESARQPLFPGLKYPRSPRYKHEAVPVSDALTADRAQVYGIKPLLESGAVDAVCYAGAGMSPSDNTQRLFANPVAEGFAYMKRTGVFPINTVLTVREETVQRHPELPAALLKASEQAAVLYIKSLESAGPDASYMGVPVEELKESVGFDTFRPGLEHNRSAIEMMLRYCDEQGLIPAGYKGEDLFLDTGD